MRENTGLYRGKRIDNGEWVFGSLLKVEINGVSAWLIFGSEFEVINGQVYSKEHANVIPETVGQYTGLTDKNGKKIFEGDIVKGLLLFGLPVLGVASFKDGAFGLAWQRGDVDEFSAFTSMCNVEYEVIGNIHDNPELLGGDSL